MSQHSSLRSSRTGTILLILAAACVLIIGIMMFGARFGLWEPVVGFGYVRNFMNPIAYGLLALGIVGFIYQLSLIHISEPTRPY